MSTTPEELEAAQPEQQSEKEVPAAAVKEAADGSEKLASDFKKLIKSLKDGASSGVTGIIGKPQLFEKGNDNASPQRIYRSGEIPKIKIGLQGDNSSKAIRSEDPAKRSDLQAAGAPENESNDSPTKSTQQQNQATAGDAAAEPAAEQQNAKNLEHVARPLPEHIGQHDQQADGQEPRAAGRGHVVQMRPEHIRANPDAAYRGEQINQDVAPATHTVAAGDTLESVARQHLGAGAREEDVAKHVHELERVNHLRQNRPLREGQELTLPGHTADGGYVLKDAAGRTQTRWADDTERVEGADGSGHVRRYNAADGSYTEHHWGRNPQQNYELTKTADGRYLVSDNPAEAPHEPRDANDIRVAHARLNDTMETKITDPAERARFQANMDAFEQRARDRNMPPEEVAKTYQQLETLLQHEGNRPTTEAQRRVLAAQVIDQAAHPTTVDQGDKSTCNVTTVESRIYTRNPSEAARLVTEVSTTGRFTAHDGTVVRVPADSIRPDHQAIHHPPPEGERSHASQIFQVTALNMYYQTEPYTYTERGRQHVVPPGGMSYEQHRQRPGHPNDSGERLVDTTRRPPRTIGRSPDITDDGIVRVNNRLTGEATNDVVISHAGDCYGDASRVTTVQNEQQLNDHIAQAARDGKLPIIVRVETDNQPWLRDSGNGSAGGSGGAHVVSVTEYQPGPPARVKVDNQWGESRDYQGTRDLSVHDLYLSMRPAADAGQIAELQRDVDWDRAHNTIDTRKEFELLRLRHNLPADDPNKLSDADFDRMMNEQIDQAGQRWRQQRANGTFNENEQRNGLRTLGEIIATQPADKQLKLLERTHTAGCIPDDRYDRGLSNIIRNNRERWNQEDREGKGNAGERQRARQELDRILNGLTPERKAAILANSRR